MPCLLRVSLYPLLWSLLIAMPTPAISESPQSEQPADPFLWLEDVTGERQLDWVRARNAESVGALAGGEAFATLESRILSIVDSQDRIPMISKIGDHFYNFWRDAKNPKGVWRRTTLDEYRKQTPAWEQVIDLDALAAKEEENWVWHGASVLEPQDRFCLISLSRGGADADVVREFDLAHNAFVDDGFVLPEAKSRVAWRTANSLFVATDFGPGSLTSSGYPRTVREWVRGTSLAEAPLIFEGQPDDMSVGAFRDLTPGFERDFISRQMTFYSSKLFLFRDGSLIPIQKPDDASAMVHREWLLIELRSDWNIGGLTHQAGSLLAVNFTSFLEGNRTFRVLFSPTPRTSLAAFAGTRNRIILTTLDNVRSRLISLAFRDGVWNEETLPGIPPYGTASATPVDDLESDDYFLITASSLQPATLSLGTAGTASLDRLKQSPSFFQTEGLDVVQHEAISKDGTRIPYFQIGPKDLPFDGSTPTLLYG